MKNIDEDIDYEMYKYIEDTLRRIIIFIMKLVITLRMDINLNIIWYIGIIKNIMDLVLSSVT